MTLSEAARLANELAREPSSHLCAAVNGWSHPTDRATLVLADLFDAFAIKNFKGMKPYPRPWASMTTERRGSTELTQAEVIAALRDAGHDMPLPPV